MFFLTFSLGLAIVIAEVALMMFVALRAGNERSARLFILLSATIVAVIICTMFRDVAPNETFAYWVLFVLTVLTLFYSVELLWLLSSLFVPEWWERRYQLVLMSIPYVLVALVVIVDMAGQFGWIVKGAIEDGDSYRLVPALPYAIIVQGFALIGSLVYLAILGVAFVRYPANRQVVTFLFIGVFISVGFTVTSAMMPSWRGLVAIIQVLPVTLALGVAVLAGKLFVSTRAAFDLALQSMSDAAAVIDTNGKIIFVNPCAAELGLRLNEPLPDVFASMRGAASEFDALTAALSDTPQTVMQRLTIGDRLVSVTLTPVEDVRGRSRGTLLLGRDITQLEQHNVLLEQERAQLAYTVERLEAEQQERARLAETVQALSMPVIPVLEGVLVLPLIGAFDEARIREYTTALLRGVERERAKLVLIDITGVPLLDELGAAGLIRGVEAAGLLGARCVLVGVRPEIAQSLVALGVPLDGLATAANLQQALLSVVQGVTHSNGKNQLAVT